MSLFKSLFLINLVGYFSFEFDLWFGLLYADELLDCLENREAGLWLLTYEMSVYDSRLHSLPEQALLPSCWSFCNLALILFSMGSIYYWLLVFLQASTIGLSRILGENTCRYSCFACSLTCWTWSVSCSLFIVWLRDISPVSFSDLTRVCDCDLKPEIAVWLCGRLSFYPWLLEFFTEFWSQILLIMLTSINRCELFGVNLCLLPVLPRLVLDALLTSDVYLWALSDAGGTLYSFLFFFKYCDWLILAEGGL